MNPVDPLETVGQLLRPLDVAQPTNALWSSASAASTASPGGGRSRSSIFRPRGGFEAELVRFYEELGVLRQPLGGLERTLGRIAQAIREGEAAFGQDLEQHCRR